MLVTGGFGDDGEVVDAGGKGGEVYAARGEGCWQGLAEGGDEAHGGDPLPARDDADGIRGGVGEAVEGTKFTAVVVSVGHCDKHHGQTFGVYAGTLPVKSLTF